MTERNIAVGRSADDGNDHDWAARSEFWRTHTPAQIGPGRRKKFKYREPLILCGHGIQIRIDHGTLHIRNGFTHYPQKSEQIRFFPGDANLPDRIILLDASGSVSFDALNWMSEQTIELVQLNWKGEAISVAGNSGYCANSILVEAQKSAKAGAANLRIARWLIAEKFESSILTLENAIPKSEIREAAISRIKNRIFEIRNMRNLISISSLLGIEGICAAAYFKAWQGLPINWTRNKRKPIPDNWREIGPRVMGWRYNSRNARQPFNAMLNYGYGILASQMRKQVVAAGFDPAIGVMHGNKDNRIPLVYDLMEPLRPVADRAILKFALSHKFVPGDFTINKWGGCRLNPQLAKSLVGQIALDNEPGTMVRKFQAALQK